MERQIPKNVRQIGNVSDTPKIYVEDYVDTFFSQLCEKVGEEPIGAFLVGDFVESDENEYVYIYGAIKMHDLKMSGNEYVLDEETWKSAYEDCKQYFEDGEMLGWFVAHAGVPLTAENSTLKLHKKSFPKNNTIFILRDPVDQDEKYFVHKFNDLIEVGGHFTYYEKNPCMQNYMISARKKNGVCPSETVEDRAAKDFRSLVRSREEQQSQRRTNRLMYAMSACLVLIVVIMGVATMNNFDKMKAVQSMIEGTGSVAEAKQEEVKETSGGVTAVIEKGQAPGDGFLTEADTGGTQNTVDTGGSTQMDDTGQQVDLNEETEGADNEVMQNSAAGEEMGQAAEDRHPSMDTGDGRDNGSDGIYIVEEGDTLAIISKKMYGDVSHTEAISKMNGLSDGNLIYIGQKLLLP